jgi:hypothetical protein
VTLNFNPAVSQALTNALWFNKYSTWNIQVLDIMIFLSVTLMELLVVLSCLIHRLSSIIKASGHVTLALGQARDFEN